jgi:hypothetical protein
MNEAQMERRLATERRGQFIGYAGENVSDETDISLTGVPCAVCELCGAVAFEAEK